MSYRDFSVFTSIGKRFRTNQEYCDWIVSEYPELKDEVSASINKNTLSRIIYQHEKSLSKNENPVNLLEAMFKINDEFWSKQKSKKQAAIDSEIDKLIAQSNAKRNVTSNYDTVEKLNDYVIHLNNNINPAFNVELAKQFKKLCLQTPETAKILFEVQMSNDDKPSYFRLNTENIDFISSLIENGGDWNEALYDYYGGSDIDWYGMLTHATSIKIIDINQLPDELKKYHIKNNEHGYFPFTLNTDKFGDLSKYQIFQSNQERNDELCLIYALRQSKLVDDLTLIDIQHDLSTFPFVSNSGVKYIAEKYNLHIYLGVVYLNKKMQIRNFEFGAKDKAGINLLSFYNHVIYVDNYKERMNIARMICELFNGNHLIPLDVKYEKHVQEIPILFKVSDYEVRRYKSKSDNIVAKFYNGIPDLYQIGGNLQYAIRKCCYGPRVLICGKKVHIKGPIADCDINALYMYAISKLFLQLGKPKVLGQQTFEYVISHKFDDLQVSANQNKFISSAFMWIDITKINKLRKYPVINGLHVGRYWVDLIILEDLLQYHEIEGYVVNGFYYDGNRDYSIRSFISDLYAKRKSNPELETELKLAMNKIYGYTIRKRVPTKEKDSENELLDMIKNYHVALNARNGKITKYKKWTNLFNMANFGSYILSMSKHIMNEIIYNLEDKGADVLYSDTDSIFIRERDLHLVEHKFGDKLGEFKIDFDHGFKRAVEMIILAKKRYICKLDENTYHFRYVFKNKSEITNPWQFYVSQLKQ